MKLYEKYDVPHVSILVDLLLYIKSYRRIKAVEFLVRNDIPVDVFGNGLEKVAFADKLRLHGPISYEESLHVAS